MVCCVCARSNSFPSFVGDVHSSVLSLCYMVKLQFVVAAAKIYAQWQCLRYFGLKCKQKLSSSYLETKKGNVSLYQGTPDATELTPRIVEELLNHRIIDISAGDSHALALTHDSTVYAWGNNSVGQCGQVLFISFLMLCSVKGGVSVLGEGGYVRCAQSQGEN